MSELKNYYEADDRPISVSCVHCGKALSLKKIKGVLATARYEVATERETRLGLDDFSCPECLSKLEGGSHAEKTQNLPLP